jgi:hypothetical protein
LSPENAFFNTIKNIWKDLNTNPDVDIKILDDVIWKEEAVLFYTEILAKRTKRDEISLRDDYREMAEIALMLLGKIHRLGFSWKKPGATHKARFCAFGKNKCLFYNKTTLEAFRLVCFIKIYIYIFMLL